MGLSWCRSYLGGRPVAEPFWDGDDAADRSFGIGLRVTGHELRSGPEDFITTAVHEREAVESERSLLRPSGVRLTPRRPPNALPPSVACPTGGIHDQAVPCKGCILVVDDDRDVREALTECFEELGCTVMSAVDGVDAAERLGDSPKPCLALLDMNMPRLDGAGLASFIRAHRAHCGLPLVSMTAGTDRLEPPLVDHHQHKPFSFEVLTPLIEKYCQDPDWLHGRR